MNVLGVRCSNSDYTFYLVTGSKDAPSIVDSASNSFPKGYSVAEQLKWLLQETTEFIDRNQVDRVVIKRDELRKGSNAFEDRVSFEATVLLAAANANISVLKKLNATISKNFGFKGRARYLVNLDTSPFPGYAKMGPRAKDALLVAWSELE